MITDHLIALKDISFFRQNKILDNVSFSLKKGFIYSLFGRSGSGKTTLLKIMTNQEQPDSGFVYFRNQALGALSNKSIYEIRKKMSVLFQSPALFSDLDIFDNLSFPLIEHTSLHKNLIKNLVLIKLELFNLRSFANYMPSELSGGMARRAAFARSTMLQPDIIFFDEPFVGQDPCSIHFLLKKIKFLSKNFGVTCFIISHDINAALAVSDQVFFLSDKKVIDCGSSSDFRSSSNADILAFLNDSSSDNFNLKNNSLSSGLLEDLLC